MDTSLVVNLSGVVLRNEKINLLSKGLSFCPMPCHVNRNQLLDDLERYFRRLRLREFFADHNEAKSSEEGFFIPRTNGCPLKGEMQP